MIIRREQFKVTRCLRLLLLFRLRTLNALSGAFLLPSVVISTRGKPRLQAAGVIARAAGTINVYAAQRSWSDGRRFLWVDVVVVFFTFIENRTLTRTIASNRYLIASVARGENAERDTAGETRRPVGYETPVVRYSGGFIIFYLNSIYLRSDARAARVAR